MKQYLESINSFLRNYQESSGVFKAYKSRAEKAGEDNIAALLGVIIDSWEYTARLSRQLAEIIEVYEQYDISEVKPDKYKYMCERCDRSVKHVKDGICIDCMFHMLKQCEIKFELALQSASSWHSAYMLMPRDESRKSIENWILERIRS